MTDAAKVLDALKDPVNGYYDPRDVFTTIPRSAVLPTSYAAHAASPGSPGSLKGVRIGVIRESMVTFPGIKADEPISAAAAREIKEVLGGQLGATLVESVDPLWPDDPDLENMRTTYTRALAELVPVFFPQLLFRLNDQGQPVYTADLKWLQYKVRRDKGAWVQIAQNDQEDWAPKSDFVPPHRANSHAAPIETDQPQRSLSLAKPRCTLALTLRSPNAGCHIVITTRPSTWRAWPWTLLILSLGKNRAIEKRPSVTISTGSMVAI